MKDKKQRLKQEKKSFQRAYLLFFLLFAIQLAGYGYPTYDISDDIAVETVNSIISDDAVYATNPYTGEIENGDSKYPLVMEFYAFLSVISGVESCHMIYRVMPVWLCMLAYIVYYNFAEKLFNGDKKKEIWFLIALCGLNLFGKNAEWSPFSKMLAQPWLGERIFCFLLIPVSVWIMMELALNVKNLHGWVMLAVLSLAAGLVYEKAVWFMALMGAVLLGLDIGRQINGMVRDYKNSSD